jgi:8-oxo-dGTP diphosphatase
MENRPKVGIAVFVIKDDKILLGKRKNAHGEGCWSCPSGHLEYQESWEDCAKREVMEEAGIEIKNIRFSTATNDIFEKEQKHYITIYMISDFVSGEVKIMEPHKCEQWEWFEWGKLPHPLFLPINNLLKTKFNPFNLS